MNAHSLFDYPNNLQIIFDKLAKNGINSILIGGYVRDKFLNLDSKDIDIELYGVHSFNQLENILEEFGEVNSVGKSFGVCKLTLENLDLDFTLPRSDNKVASGHCGFEVTIDKDLDFITATSRRDFTINAIGFDVLNKKILDPYNGQEDIKNKILRAVNIDTFSEDPLRVLRAVGFATRFNFTLEPKLFTLCKKMCDSNTLKELPQERIYTEIQKILLKSKKPSLAFLLLKELNGLQYFYPLDTLSNNSFNEILDSLNTFVNYKTLSNKINILIMLSLMSSKFKTEDTILFITKLTNNKSILKEILTLLVNDFKIFYTDSELLRLSCQVSIEYFLLFSQAKNKNINGDIFKTLKHRAKELGVLYTKAKPFLQGRDIIALGFEPSKKFSTILELAYEAQINLEINSHIEAKKWLQVYFKSQ
ncbi:MAG: tRNA nucleotidyltransferase (CCA-adding enzyme) [Sulfurimonas sp.]|jgi:tRNA nucleotidyltransferase (CCA-adding enzyme)|uniref:CCA tRNA nucleotidyltransferase n=1 Tax=Sulfurimonas sp. TaxID=2022749 RepID=UPI0039E29EB7